MEYCNKISYNQARVLYDEGKTVYVKYQTLGLKIETAMFNKDISCFESLPQGIFHLFIDKKASIILEYSNTIYIDTDSPIDKEMKTKLNSLYGRSCTMRMTHERFNAVETTVTLVRCLRKEMLEPSEPLVLATCQQIENDYKAGYIDKALMQEIADKLSDLKCQYAFDI